jgi:hypothetical protein
VVCFGGPGFFVRRQRGPGFFVRRQRGPGFFVV